MQDYLESKNVPQLEGNFGLTAGNTRIIGLLLCCIQENQAIIDMKDLMGFVSSTKTIPDLKN